MYICLHSQILTLYYLDYESLYEFNSHIMNDTDYKYIYNSWKWDCEVPEISNMNVETLLIRTNYKETNKKIIKKLIKKIWKKKQTFINLINFVYMNEIRKHNYIHRHI